MELNGKFSKEEMQIAMKYFPIALFCFFPPSALQITYLYQHPLIFFNASL